jgi:uncharacterized membrane protein (UPF0127 family)
VIIAVAAASTIAVVFASIFAFVPGERHLPPIGASAISKTAGNASAPADPTANYTKANVTVNNFTLVAAIAETESQKETGLDVRSSMAENQGMLFPFPEEGDHAFWMKGMKFPIDIIWLDANKTVIHIEHSLPPCTGSDLMCPTHDASQKSMYVLETTAGFSDRHSVREGTRIAFNLTRS